MTIFNVYCPRADPEKPDRLHFKLRFYKLLECRATAVSQSGSHVIIVGDINTSHRQIDRCENVDEVLYVDTQEQDANFDSSCLFFVLTCFVFFQEEFLENPSRKWLNSFVLDSIQSDCETVSSIDNASGFQMVDSFRLFHPDVTDAFTCWNTKANARATNYGSRIDYIFVDRLLIQSMSDSLILSEVLGSDHCPVVGKFNIKPVKASKCPAACIKNFPEFSGVQQKLSCFFSKKPEMSPLTSVDVLKPEPVPQAESASLKRKFSEDDKSWEEYKNRSVFKKNKTQRSSTQRQIMSFFKKSTNATGEALERSCSILSGPGPHDSLEPSFDNGSVKDTELSVDRPERSSLAVSAWRSMLTGPRPPPMCKGHKEPCVERTVKKKGPNFNRKFFACARGEGSKTDPRARCDHFEWAQKK